MKPKNRHTYKALAGTALLALMAALPALADNYQTAVVSQNPVGYWRLDETAAPLALPVYAADLGSLGKLGVAGEGLYAQDVLRGQPGALSGGANTSSRFSNPGWGLDFLADSVVDVPLNPALNPHGPFSVEFWAKPSSTAPDLFSPVCSLDEGDGSYRKGYLVYYDGAASRWNFRLGGGTNVYTNVTATGDNYIGDISGGAATPGVWSHVVAVYNGSSAALYVNGAQVASEAVAATQFAVNSTNAFRIGATTIPNRNFDGWIQEVAFYNAALDGDTIGEHYAVGTTNGGGYSTLVLASNPVGYWRLGEPADPPAANLGTLGAAASGRYIHNAMPGQPGPAAPVFPGFAPANKAVSFDGLSGSVSLSPLNLDTNTVAVTITAWVLPNGSQNAQAGIVVNDLGDKAAGLQMDETGGLKVSYNWNNDQSAYAWLSTLSLADSVWNFVALVVQPTEADLYIVDSTNAADFTGATNYITHAVQNFESYTLVGDNSVTNFNGSICQVAIFNRSLSEGEVFSEYAAAIGNLKPQVFVNPSAPPGTVFAGDTDTLTVDAGGTPPLNYQWYLGTARIPGATNTTLTQVFYGTNAGNYSVTVANSYGTVTSGMAALTVSPVTQPAVAQGPQSRTLYAGASLDLNVTASGGALSYQWQLAATNIPGATNSSYLAANVTAANAGAYSVIVSNRLGATNFGPVTITIPAPAAGSYEAAVTASKPVSWWRLDEAPGSTNMWDSMGRHDGYYTNISGTPVTLGVPGALLNESDSAVSFDGSSASYGVVPYSPALNAASGTLECWVNAGASFNSGVAVSSQFGSKGWFFAPTPSTNDPSGWTLFYNAPGGPYLTPSTNGAGAIDLGWTHLAVIYGTTGVTLYVNGHTDNSIWGNWDLNGAGPLLIGALGESSTTSPDSFFNGQVDEVAIYATELTSAQILAHYEGRYGLNTKPIFRTSLFSQVVAAGTPTSFSTVVEGTLPISLQWTKNGAAIAGATNGTLTFAKTVLSDTATYELVATNGAGKTNLSASLLVLPPPTFANVTNHLLLHLKFDGNYKDSAGQGYNGTNVGAPTFVPGKIGSQALHYSTMTSTNADGTQNAVTNANYVSLGTNTVLSDLGARWTNGSGFSVSFWTRLPAGYLGGDLPFLGSATNSDNSFGFTFSPSYDLGGWEWCLNDGTNNIDINGPNNAINDGNWHHLLVTFDHAAALGITYLDGLQVHADSLAGLGNFDSGGSISIGQDPTGLYPEAGSADIDDLAVWQDVLTPFDVCLIYGAGANAGASFDTVGQPKLGIARSGNDVLFIWQGGALLQATSFGGPWTPVPGATAPTATITPGPANTFYRVQM